MLINYWLLTLCIFMQAVLTRKVDTKDYKLFSIGTVESADREVLHVIGILGNWWIYRASYGK